MSELMNKDFFSDLIKDTEFVLAKEGSLMNSRKKVSTPLYAINCIYGGGIPLGIIGEISGPPSSGKSTFAYQCMGNFQREYPDGVPVIYDMESSMDDSRLEVLGVDTDRVLRLPATSLEEAFASMFTILNKIDKARETVPDISSFQIYDTISSGGTEKQHKSVEAGNSAFGAGSMMEAPRIIKQNLMNLFPYLEKYPLGVMLLNQVFTQMSMYSSKLASGGGLGLKHACHSHITFGENKDVFENGFLVGTQSLVRLEKSKLSPKLVDIPCYIDATIGGKIDEVDSFVRYLSASHVAIVKIGSWYNIKDTIDSMIQQYPVLDKKEVTDLKANFRKNDFYQLIHDNDDLCKLLQIRLIDFIDGIYPMQRKVNDEYQKSLITSCGFFDGYDPYSVKEEQEVTEEIVSEEVTEE